MKLISSMRLAAFCGLVIVVAIITTSPTVSSADLTLESVEKYEDLGRILVKRQASRNNQRAEATGKAKASASVAAEPDDEAEDEEESRPTRRPEKRRGRRPKTTKPPVMEEDTMEEEEAETERPARRRGSKANRAQGKGKNKKEEKAMADEADEEDDEDCLEGLGSSFMQMATRPMKQFNRMMDKMMSGRIPDTDGTSASAASFSSDGMDSGISSSVVNNNGRTRGVVTEFKNGKAKTRRFGSDSDDDEEAEENE